MFNQMFETRQCKAHTTQHSECRYGHVSSRLLWALFELCLKHKLNKSNTNRHAQIDMEKYKRFLLHTKNYKQLTMLRAGQTVFPWEVLIK